ncbi:hypothetical protein [Methylovulum psychrotolerans]|uniref:Uncharacterized protein n=1 Tax=Methylovulum psychrotolerans TaxID=1704499 RepID=A0A1Z4C0F9_9GAMM|nr:hypothetical protein [Methylovulum psychrotolerans]ASF47028.1 hypothetical protein CEK71_13625 [Methylovulum psychrotolerans]
MITETARVTLPAPPKNPVTLREKDITEISQSEDDRLKLQVADLLKREQRFDILRDAVVVTKAGAGITRFVDFELGKKSGWILNDLAASPSLHLFLGEAKEEALAALEQYAVDNGIFALDPSPLIDAAMRFYKAIPADNFVPPTTEPAKQYRMVEWENVGHVVYELDTSLLTEEYLSQIIAACRQYPCNGLTDDYIEETGLFTCALQALTDIILRFELYNRNALTYFLTGGFTLLPPLIGQHGIRLVEVDASEPTLDNIFVGPAYR